MPENKRQRRILPHIILSMAFCASLGFVFWIVEKSFDEIMQDTLRRSTESSHGDMVLFASSALQTEIIELIDAYEKSAPVTKWSDFSNTNNFTSFDEKVRQLFFRTDVLKLKIYANDGFTIFATDPRQIGEEKSEIEEVTHALRGRSSSQFSFRESFMGLNGNFSDIEVVSSYHPLITAEGIIKGVVEVYSDRSSDFIIAEAKVRENLAMLLIVLALSFSVWLITLIYHNLQRRSGDL